MNLGNCDSPPVDIEVDGKPVAADLNVSYYKRVALLNPFPRNTGRQFKGIRDGGLALDRHDYTTKNTLKEQPIGEGQWKS
jgi:hypothetical protein